MTVLIWVIPLLLFSFYVQGFDSNKFDVIFFVQGIVLLYLVSFSLIFLTFFFQHIRLAYIWLYWLAKKQWGKMQYKG